MPIPPNEYKKIREKLFAAGRDNEHPFIFEALHDEAHDTVDKVVRDAGYSMFDEADVCDADLDDLAGAYKDGFWENANKTEIVQLKAFISDGIASTKGTSDPRFPDLFVPRVPMLSTQHMTEDDSVRVLAGHPSIIARYDEGCFMHIGNNASEIEKEFAGFSIECRNLMLRLVEAGYTYVRFDSDAVVCPSFPTFDW